MNVICVKDFSFTYPQGNTIIRSLSFDLEKGEMMLLCGKNGCGKSTLLRSLKKEVAPKGKREGTIEINGSSQILFQDCDKNIIFRSAFEDLIFPACNSGMPEETILQKADEVLELFGISHLRDRDTATLSGGEKQILSLASLFMLSPDLLLLDEPLAQLDEQAKAAFLQKLKPVQQAGTAIIIAEHNTDALLEQAQKVLIFSESGNEVFTKEDLAQARAFPDFPDYICLEQKLTLSVKDFTKQEAVENLNAIKPRLTITPIARNLPEGNTVLSGEQLTFSYPQKQVLSSLSFSLKAGEIAFLNGANGAGKTTLLELLCGFHQAKTGQVRLSSGQHLGYLAQNPVYSFLQDSLQKDCSFLLRQNRLEQNKTEALFARYPLFEDLKALLPKNPLDFSGGELAKAAIFKLLLIDRTILLLDEPEKHLDRDSMEEFSCLIKDLAAGGISFIIVSHSPDFMYRTAHTVWQLEGGSITTYRPQDYFPAQCQTSLYQAIAATELPLFAVQEAEVTPHG
ncbi:MAG: ATP-binding cassette domain-containing protein [Clostridia bacterium]|nr:ATP-binding cassette domain-containing protein [Clostridia bacterium]